jgi:hypothetical protein
LIKNGNGIEEADFYLKGTKALINVGLCDHKTKYQPHCFSPKPDDGFSRPLLVADQQGSVLLRFISKKSIPIINHIWFFNALTLSIKTTAHETHFHFFSFYFFLFIHQSTANAETNAVWEELDGHHWEDLRC